jgi:hypothetical protein
MRSKALITNKILHPDLVRVALAYDNILRDYSFSYITATQAQRNIWALKAFDDNGLEWSINPESGEWRYRTYQDELIIAEPPFHTTNGNVGEYYTTPRTSILSVSISNQNAGSTVIVVDDLETSYIPSSPRLSLSAKTRIFLISGIVLIAASLGILHYFTNLL